MKAEVIFYDEQDNTIYIDCDYEYEKDDFGYIVFDLISAYVVQVNDIVLPKLEQVPNWINEDMIARKIFSNLSI